MNNSYWLLTSLTFIVDLALRIGLSLRVIMRKRSYGVSMAWLVVILFLPFAGAIVYLMFGETRLGEKRTLKLINNRPYFAPWMQSVRKRTHVDWEHINPECIPLDRHIKTTIGIPTVPSNDLELIENASCFFKMLISDIRNAKNSCSLEFYIWNEGGQADNVANELIKASQRGVRCRLLLDSIGSKSFFSSKLAKKMKKVGIEIVEVLPARLFHMLFIRIDLRNHRKLAIIDSTVAYSGSQNLVDPKFFKQKQHVGQWVDTMVRIRGPVVEVLSASFLYDWMIERPPEKDGLNISSIKPAEPAGNTPIQVVPSGPGSSGESTLHDLLLTTIYAARKEITITTPYFVPDTAISDALTSAAHRGVRVTLIVPEKNDSFLVRYASQFHFDNLIKAGVKVMLFSGGLLHAKTITVDGDFCLYGSVNLDMRSFWLNFEMTLFVYEKEFTCRVKELQHTYLLGTKRINYEQFKTRPFRKRFMENTAHLLGPLL